MGQVRPRRRLPKVSQFLTSKPGVQRRIGLLATWRTSEDCVEAKKIKSSSWWSVPDISESTKRAEGDTSGFGFGECNTSGEKSAPVKIKTAPTQP
ncbi:hypothetical protein U9M48_031742, partial [Paspalum notatum var. saurae]